MDPQGAFEKYQMNFEDLKALSIAFGGAESVGLEILNDQEQNMVYKTLNLLKENDKYISSGKKQYYRLKTLGKDKINSEDNNEKDFEQLQNAASALIASTDVVEFILNKKDHNINYILAGEDLPKEKLQNSLKSGVNNAEVCEYAVPFNNYKNNGYAKCISFVTKDDMSAENTISSNWVDAVISADLSGDYTIIIQAITADADNIKNRLQKLSEWYEELERLNDITKNISLGKDDSVSSNDNYIKTLAGFASNNTGGSNISVSLSQTVRASVVKQLLDNIEKKISELTQALVGGIKSVTITCSAEKIFDYQILTSIIKSSLVKSNYEVSWVSGKETQPATEILNKDVSKFFYLPSKDFPGFERKENDKLSVNSVDEDGELKLGKVYWNGSITDREFTMQMQKLNRHFSVFGMTGSGKSTTVFGILEQSKVPFMVIEPVKGEYRKLKKYYDNLDVYHMDADKQGVLQINPFWFPLGGSLSFHMDALKKIISSAFALYAAMPNILEQCIYNCYVKKGWNVVKSTNVFAESIPEDYLYPTFSDLCDEIELYLKNSDFQGETLSSYKGALLSRLKSFTTGSKGVLLNSTKHPDFDKWKTNNCIIELDGLADDADKSIVMGSLIMQYFQNIKKDKNFTNNLKHIIVVEEAHRLFKSNTTQNVNQEVSAPEAQLVESLSNMMAEIRAYGEGFVIVDQSPSKVAEDVVSNSSTKIVHRLDNKKDIDMLENSLLMKDISTIISGLTKGDAIVRTEGMVKPIKIKVNKSEKKDSDYQYEQETAVSGLENSSNVDFIMNNSDFCTEFVKLSEKFINQLLYDDLYNARGFFAVYIQQLNKILYLGGFSEIADNADKNFFLLLTSEGVKKALTQNDIKQTAFTLQMRMFADRICELLADGEITRKEIKAFTEFRSSILHEQIVIKNKNGGLQEHGIAIACGFQTIYTDLLSKLMLLIDDKEFNINKQENMTVEFFEKALSSAWKELFVIEPEKIIRENILLLLRSLYISVL